MTKTETRQLSKENWRAEARRRFGDDPMKWAFVCPACGHRATVSDWKRAGAPEGAVAFSCVGRWTENPRDAFARKGRGPCNYAGGGLIGLNPVDVEGHHVFEFAEAQTQPAVVP